MYKLFLAWQSQNQSTAKFVKKHLDKAKKELRKEGIEIDILKTPTQDEAGSPDINNAIWEQIKLSDVFFADMSFVSKEIQMSNGNVMYETGIADALLGSSRVIMVCDQETDIENICFDINHKRISRINTSNNDQYKEFAVWIKAALEEADKDRYIRSFSNETYAEDLLFLVNYFWGLLSFCSETKEISRLKVDEDAIKEILKKSDFPEFYICIDLTTYIKELEDKLLKLYPFSHKKIAWYIMRIIMILKEYNNFFNVTKMGCIEKSNKKIASYAIYDENNFKLNQIELFSESTKHLLLNGKKYIFHSMSGGFLVLDKRVKWCLNDDSIGGISDFNEHELQSAYVRFSDASIEIVSSFIRKILDAMLNYFSLVNVEMMQDEAVGLVVLKIK